MSIHSTASSQRFYAERIAGSEPSLSRALLNVIKILNKWQPSKPLAFAGEIPYPIELNEVYITNYLDRIKEQQAQGKDDYFFCIVNITILLLLFFMILNIHPMVTSNISGFPLKFIISLKYLN